MPYIPKDDRANIDYTLSTLKAHLGIDENLPVGKLNYIISTLLVICWKLMKPHILL